MNKDVIIVAGGQGLRMGADLPKQFLLLNGKPVLMHTIQAFYRYDPDSHIIVVLPDSHLDYWKELCTKYSFTITHTIALGGETRFHSVQNALYQTRKDSLVAIHDAVRPLISEDIISRTFKAAEDSIGAYPVIPVTDTIKKKINDYGIYKTVDRNDYCLVQTPQVFQGHIIRKAYEQEYSESFTDDVSVVEYSRFKRSIVTVSGSSRNIKITTPDDLILAEALMKCRT